MVGERHGLLHRRLLRLRAHEVEAEEVDVLQQRIAGEQATRLLEPVVELDLAEIAACLGLVRLFHQHRDLDRHVDVAPGDAAGLSGELVPHGRGEFPVLEEFEVLTRELRLEPRDLDALLRHRHARLGLLDLLLRHRPVGVGRLDLVLQARRLDIVADLRPPVGQIEQDVAARLRIGAVVRGVLDVQLDLVVADRARPRLETIELLELPSHGIEARAHLGRVVTLHGGVVQPRGRHVHAFARLGQAPAFELDRRRGERGLLCHLLLAQGFVLARALELNVGLLDLRRVLGEVASQVLHVFEAEWRDVHPHPEEVQARRDLVELHARAGEWQDHARVVGTDLIVLEGRLDDRGGARFHRRKRRMGVQRRRVVDRQIEFEHALVDRLRLGKVRHDVRRITIEAVAPFDVQVGQAHPEHHGFDRQVEELVTEGAEVLALGLFVVPERDMAVADCHRQYPARNVRQVGDRHRVMRQVVHQQAHVTRISERRVEGRQSGCGPGADIDRHRLAGFVEYRHLLGRLAQREGICRHQRDGAEGVGLACRPGRRLAADRVSDDAGDDRGRWPDSRPDRRPNDGSRRHDLGAAELGQRQPRVENDTARSGDREHGEPLAHLVRLGQRAGGRRGVAAARLHVRERIHCSDLRLALAGRVECLDAALHDLQRVGRFTAPRLEHGLIVQEGGAQLGILGLSRRRRGRRRRGRETPCIQGLLHLSQRHAHAGIGIHEAPGLDLGEHVRRLGRQRARRKKGRRNRHFDQRCAVEHLGALGHDGVSHAGLGELEPIDLSADDGRDLRVQHGGDHPAQRIVGVECGGGPSRCQEAIRFDEAALHVPLERSLRRVDLVARRGELPGRVDHKSVPIFGLVFWRHRSFVPRFDRVHAGAFDAGERLGG